MPVILVATDFSAAGDNAAFYGASLARAWDCELALLHAYFLPVTFNDPAMPIIPMEEMQEANMKRMAKAAAGISEAFPELLLTTRIEYGDIEDLLEELMEEVQPALLVIGSHPEQEESFWLGNRSAALLRSSKTPILAVPEGYTYQQVENVCIAVDKAGMPQDAAYEGLQSLLKMTKANLHILHVVKDAQADGLGQPSMPLPAFEDGINVRFHLTSAERNIDDEIAGFAAANAIDWLVLIPHHYTFWESLFHKSHTKGVIHKSNIPVLALH